MVPPPGVIGNCGVGNSGFFNTDNSAVLQRRGSFAAGVSCVIDESRTLGVGGTSRFSLKGVSSRQERFFDPTDSDDTDSLEWFSLGSSLLVPRFLVVLRGFGDIFGSLYLMLQVDVFVFLPLFDGVASLMWILFERNGVLATASVAGR